MPTSAGYSISINQVQHYAEQLIALISSPAFLTGVTLAVTLPFCFVFWLNARPRLSAIPPYRERVLILGASSGTGEQLALEYAARGCRHIVLVGRREELLDRVKERCQEAAKKGEEWRMAQQAPGWEENQGKERYWVCKADCSNPVDVSKIRDLVMKELGGLDTLHLCFGVSALKPLLGLANVDPIRPTRSSTPGSTTPSSSSLVHASLAGLQSLTSIVDVASHINLTATALCLAAFIPVLQTTNSSDPAIVLLSSVAALIPAPTRALYAATKAAQLQLFESVEMECESHANFERVRAAAKERKRRPERRQALRFIAVCPGTILSDFRASAVDVKPGEEGEVKDASWGLIQSAEGGKPKKLGDILTTKQVADRAMHAVDGRLKGKIIIPAKYALANTLKPFIGPIISRIAHKKYDY